MARTPVAPVLAQVLDEFAPLGGPPVDPGALAEAARADAKRQHDDYARALAEELVGAEIKAEFARQELDDVLAAHRRATEEWERLAIGRRLAEAGEKADATATRVADIKTEIARHKKDRPS
jgi:polyhydroxyalkanoate synthesis regulator phasin